MRWINCSPGFPSFPGAPGSPAAPGGPLGPAGPGRPGLPGLKYLASSCLKGNSPVSSSGLSAGSGWSRAAGISWLSSIPRLKLLFILDFIFSPLQGLLCHQALPRVLSGQVFQGVLKRLRLHQYHAALPLGPWFPAGPRGPGGPKICFTVCKPDEDLTSRALDTTAGNVVSYSDDNTRSSGLSVVSIGSRFTSLASLYYIII